MRTRRMGGIGGQKVEEKFENFVWTMYVRNFGEVISKKWGRNEQ